MQVSTLAIPCNLGTVASDSTCFAVVVQPVSIKNTAINISFIAENIYAFAINTALMLKRKKRQKTPQHRRSEYCSYQANNPLTRYVERVCGINSTIKRKNRPN
tara:strand:+ start:331 stop:639 length:309 start_codon:yes stop_codon:yes gene_type:complete